MTHADEYVPVRSLIDYDATLAAAPADTPFDSTALHELNERTLQPVHPCTPELSFAWLLDDYLVYIKATARVRSAPANQRLPTLSIDFNFK